MHFPEGHLLPELDCVHFLKGTCGLVRCLLGPDLYGVHGTPWPDLYVGHYCMRYTYNALTYM